MDENAQERKCMRTVLFSPIGGTDPISAINIHDGAALHISRCYQPDVIYLYLSNEILTIHEQDNRYLYCLQELDKAQGRHTEYHLIKRPDLTDVQDFDIFYPDFLDIIHEITDEQGEDIKLILNISSGTPAMKSALMVINTLDGSRYTTVQVATPIRKMNEHSHREYEVEVLWELNEDNRTDFENRCKEVTCPNLLQIHQERVIRRLIIDYDYAGAYKAAQMLPRNITEHYIELLHMAHRRLQLDLRTVDEIGKKDGAYVIETFHESTRQYYEYALILQVKLRRCEYADFIRGLSPIIFVLFTGILKKQANIDWTAYCTMTKTGAIWDTARYANSNILQILRKNTHKFKGGYVYGSHLCALIEALCSDPNVVQMAKNLRRVERVLRNEAAHQVVSVTEEVICKKLGMSSDEVMEMIREAFPMAGMPITEEQWRSYDVMNRVIIERMEQ